MTGKKRNFSEAFLQKIQPSYSRYVTNNLHRLQYFKFGYCIFCKNKVQAELLKNICDKSTVLCYHCGADTVVPGECSRQLLNQWYEESFSISDYKD